MAKRLKQRGRTKLIDHSAAQSAISTSDIVGAVLRLHGVSEARRKAAQFVQQVDYKAMNCSRNHVTAQVTNWDANQPDVS